jgi:predicted CxxxxCH...CXXCH cytochrome family protein
MLARNSVLAVLAALAAGLVACSDVRPLQASTGTGGICASCHGGVDNATGAPPDDLAGNTATTARGVGAHTSHVEAGPVAGAFDCGECHFPKPASVGSPGHNDGTVQVVFGALAGTGTATPVWNGGVSPPTCSSVYCHGATLGGGTGTNLTPAWTAGST